jgi:antimicrobial peptide system SdpB family protein
MATTDSAAPISASGAHPAEKRLNLAGRLESWLVDGKRAQYGTSILRILLGLCAVAIVVTNFGDRRYIWGTASGWAQPYRDDSIWNFWLFRFFDAGDPDPLLAIKLVLFAVFGALMVVGWRTRIVTLITLLMFISLAALGPTSSDSADNAMRIMLIYSLITDGSLKWSLDARRRRRQAPDRLRPLPVPAWFGTIVHNLAVVAIGAQVIIIYLIAGVAKARGTLWQNGTAIYYPMHSENFSPWPALNSLLVSNDLMVHLISWGSVAIQVLFPLFLLNRWTRRLAVLGMIGMHAGIGIFLGLSVFSLAMVAADVIFLRDRTVDEALAWLRRRRRTRKDA